jgi:hypothetical protein
MFEKHSGTEHIQDMQEMRSHVWKELLNTLYLISSDFFIFFMIAALQNH